MTNTTTRNRCVGTQCTCWLTGMVWFGPQRSGFALLVSKVTPATRPERPSGWVFSNTSHEKYTPLGGPLFLIMSPSGPTAHRTSPRRSFGIHCSVQANRAGWCCHNGRCLAFQFKVGVTVRHVSALYLFRLYPTLRYRDWRAQRTHAAFPGH